MLLLMGGRNPSPLNRMARLLGGTAARATSGIGVVTREPRFLRLRGREILCDPERGLYQLPFHGAQMKVHVAPGCLQVTLLNGSDDLVVFLE